MEGLKKRFTYAELQGILSAIVVFVSSFLPQVKEVYIEPEYLEFWRFGVERGFTVILLVFLAVFACAIIYFCNRYYRKALSAIFMIFIGATIVTFMNLEIAAWTTGDMASIHFHEIQIGIYLTILGGIGLIISGLWLLFLPGKEKLYCKAGNIFSAIAFLLGIIIFLPLVFWIGPFIEVLSPNQGTSFENYVMWWVIQFLSLLLMFAGIIDYLVSRKYPKTEQLER
jgi:hypothetical protein